MEISEYLSEPVDYDNRYAEIRQVNTRYFVAKLHESLMNTEDGVIIGNFIADAINEKLKPKTTKVIETVVQISQYLQASKFILQCCNTPDFKGYNYCPICGAKIVRDKQ